MAVSATYTKDIHYSGIITVDGETVVSMDANMDANIRMFQSSIATSTTVESIVPIKRISMMLLTNSRTTSGMSMISILQIWKQRNRWSSTEEDFANLKEGELKNIWKQSYQPASVPPLHLWSA